MARRGGAAAKGFNDAEGVVQLGVGSFAEGAAQVVRQGRIAAIGSTQRLPSTRGQNRVGIMARPVHMALLNQRPVLLDLGDELLPCGREGVTLGLDPSGFRDGGTLVFLSEVVFQECLQVVLVVEDTVLAMLPDVGQFQVVGFIEDQRAAGSRLADAQVPLSANGAVEHDARAQ